jgi:hypothetical protein
MPVAQWDAVPVGYFETHSLVARVIDVGCNNPPLAQAMTIGGTGATAKPLLVALGNAPRLAGCV